LHALRRYVQIGDQAERIAMQRARFGKKPVASAREFEVQGRAYRTH
jgi:hypothetical protein